MATLAHTPPAEQVTRPTLVFFTSAVDGRCRRVEGFLAQVLQRRGNHGTFALRTVPIEEQPELFERLQIEKLPTIAVVEGKLLTARLEQPGGCREIEAFLEPWLR